MWVVTGLVEAELGRLLSLAPGAELVDFDGGPALLLPGEEGQQAVAERLGVGPERVVAAPAGDWGSTPLTGRVQWFGPLRVELLPSGGRPSGPGIAVTAGAAFGTGLHPSTALLLEVLVERRPRGLLDVGTGTGILALAALSLGAESAVGVDIDPAALAAAKDNATMNQLSARFRVESRIPSGEMFPFIVANVLGAELRELSAPLARALAPSGTAWLSGIHRSEEAEVIATYRRLGFRPLERRGGQWRALEFLAGW